MLGKTTQNPYQLSLFGDSLLQQLNPRHGLVKLSSVLPWERMEKHLSGLYSSMGAPSHPIRKMVGLLLLQHLFKWSDRSIVEVWKENPYYQYFTGEASLQWQQPCAASDLVHFRKRLGEGGLDYILKITLELHSEDIKKAKEVIVDTTVQEKNITYPTDAKLYKKVIDGAQRIAKRTGIKLRQSYQYIVKKLMYTQRYIGHPQLGKQGKKAIKKLKTIAGRQVRNLNRELTKIGKQALYAPIIATMEQIVSQEKHSKDKVYSLHEPRVSCIAKGKKGKRYEFGSKVSIASLPGSQVIVGITNYTGNPHDSQTIAPTLDQAKKLTGKRFKTVLVDRGYRGSKKLLQEEVILPGSKGMEKGSYTHRRHQERCRRRSAIEGLISHLKNYHKLGRNFLKGVLGDTLNCLLVAIGHNLHLLWVKFATDLSFLFLSLLYPLALLPFVGYRLSFNKGLLKHQLNS